MTAYYNEIDPFAAEWLRNLIARGLIASGDVDDRSIVDVRPDDLRGYTQCNFFAGIGLWSHALRLAGWPDDREVWTGSCPCQPFSAAGKREGYADERHLWPHWHRLIAECRPATVFGEQVAAAIGTGWFDDVSLSLEELDYTVGAISFPACSVGAPHIRQRLYFVAHSAGSRADRRFGVESEERDARRTEPSSGSATNGFWSDAIWLPCTDGKSRPTGAGTVESLIQQMAHGTTDGLGLVCDGNRYHISPLVKGTKNRVGRLRAYGNAIVAPQAAEFIAAFMQTMP